MGERPSVKMEVGRSLIDNKIICLNHSAVLGYSKDAFGKKTVFAADYVSILFPVSSLGQSRGGEKLRGLLDICI